MCVKEEETQTMGIDERKLFDEIEFESLAYELREK
jgi:hypothetical protein